MTRKKDRELQAARDAKELALWLSEQKGPRCMCEHHAALSLAG
jgi:hypothetical protein